MKISLKSKKIIFLSSAVLIILLVTVGSWLLFRKIIDTRRRDRFETVLHEAEILLSEGYSTEAAGLLKSLKDLPVTSTDYLKLMRLYRTDALRGNSYSDFNEIAAAASAAFPGREDLKALHVWGLLRGGMYERARKLSDELQNSVYDSLRAEALFRYPGGKTPAGEEEERNPYLRLAEEGGALEDRTPDTFIYAAEETGIEAFFTNALLLYMGLGDIDQAVSIYRANLKGQAPLLGLFLSLDDDRPATAASELASLRAAGLSLPRYELLQGDIYIRGEEYKKSSVFYREFISRYPEESWIPYYNLALSETSAGEPSVGVLNAGLVYFPDQQDLALLLAGVLLQLDREAEAEALLTRLTDSGKSEAETELKLMYLLEGRRNPAYIKGRYWAMMDRFPGNPLIFNAFALYLAAWSQWAEFDHLMVRGEDERGVTADLLTLKGAGTALRSGHSEAADYFQQAAELEKSFANFYNLGVIEEKTGYYKKAVKYFIMALERLDENKDTEAAGLTEIRLGVLYYKNFEFNDARKYLDSGLDKLPGNLEGEYYSRLLKTEVNNT